MKIHLLSGFLGSGKTTAVQQACRLLMKEGIKPAVICNDQGIKLVDGQFFEGLGIASRQVVNGCFCCNYNDLDNSIESLLESDKPDVVFAESVGSCTDIVATVLKPLLKFRKDARVTVSCFADIRLLDMLLHGTTAFDPSVNYIYFKQLEECGIVVITKTDLVTDEKQQEIRKLMETSYHGKILLFQNTFNEHHIRNWMRVLDHAVSDLSSLDIDYDIYSEGEAKLAWLDQELNIYSTKTNTSVIAKDLALKIAETIQIKQLSIGHLKFLLNGEVKISFTSAMPTFAFDDIPVSTGFSLPMLINARVQTDPETLALLVSSAIMETENKYDCRIMTHSQECFQPGYPRPTHRIIA